MHVEAFKIGTWVSNAFLSAFASTFSGAVGEAQAKNESGVQVGTGPSALVINMTRSCSCGLAVN